MPKRTDIEKILLIGSGPIVIGQACEFDYSGTQACKILRKEGYKMILVNSNPATIMTDPEFADRTYVEPLTVDAVAKIIERERPEALLPTLGGQTGLNLALDLAERGVLKKFNVEMIGAGVEAIRKAEDRALFKESMRRVGLECPRSAYVGSVQEASDFADEVGYPLILRPSFTLGGTGGSIAHTPKQLKGAIEWALELSPVHKVLVEESVMGWKEYELEVMRDRKDNVVIVCPIENFDPMGVHTGDSITVAPAQTLTDKEYQILRDASIKIIREIGVDTGGSNIQFATHPKTGRVLAIEMNPRVSRSSALASKATGFPIAKIAALLAVGYTLDEIPNDITKKTPACFEPTIDYVVTKIPRFTFEKFKAADNVLTTQMKSVGEVMAIGRTFKESLLKAVRSLEIDVHGLYLKDASWASLKPAARKKALLRRLKRPSSDRLWLLAEALRMKVTVADLYRRTGVDPWFLDNLAQVIDAEAAVARAREDFRKGRVSRGRSILRHAKEIGLSDIRIGQLTGLPESQVRVLREKWKVQPVYKAVDTCAAEFEAQTPYLYSTYESEDEMPPTGRKKVIILGGGPNRIGQGIEFDYCCVHGSFALREEDFEAIMVNCNPETVSTDYDTSDRLYFEPLTYEDVMSIIRREKPEGVIIQFGGQTPLKLAVPLARARVPILGTSPRSIDIAEDRGLFSKLVRRLKLRQPRSGLAYSLKEALTVAGRIGYPILTRPSYVLGGRAMEIIYDEAMLGRYVKEAIWVSPDHPVLIDQFLKDATEVDVDAISDGRTTVIGGVMQHIEEAGIHSGDSACALPPYSLSLRVTEQIREQTKRLAAALRVVGLMNVQFAVKDEEVYILEVNPRASRTIPFVSKAIGVPLAKLATKVLVGRTLEELKFTKEMTPSYVSVKEAVLPFTKFPGVDPLLGPEMKSTGEVMGIDDRFEIAFAKSQVAAGMPLPSSGNIFLSVKNADKPAILDVARRYFRLGFRLYATRGTGQYMESASGGEIHVNIIKKVKEGSPNILDLVEKEGVALVINTTSGAADVQDSYPIRATAIRKNIPYYTTVEGAQAVSRAAEALRQGEMGVKCLQSYYQERDLSAAA
ncbi:MAG: carbamoyl-phosphate synthase large subunit [Nitrospirae bacterium]|nr:carbamoyl-phosphate synthase large subunit [Nitrospirota bacterium]